MCVWGGGGGGPYPGADTGFPEGGGDIHKHPPPLDIVRVTSSALRKIEKHPHSWTFTSTPLDIARVTSSTFQGGGGVIGPGHSNSIVIHRKLHHTLLSLGNWARMSRMAMYGTYVVRRDGSKSFFASPSQVTSHFLASPSQVTSHFRASPSQVTSHLVRRQVKSSHKSFGPNTSQVTSLFVQVQVKSHIISSTPRHKKGNIIKSKRK